MKILIIGCFACFITTMTFIVVLVGCDSRSIEQRSGYPLAITTPAIEAVIRFNVRPIYCDSVQEDGYCVRYWQDGRGGRICGDYTVYPIR